MLPATVVAHEISKHVMQHIVAIQKKSVFLVANWGLKFGFLMVLSVIV